MLTSPSGKAYIGQTFRPIQTRLEEHETGKSSGCVAIYNAIQYHGWNNFEKDWYECPDEDLNKHEELMVEVLGTLAPGGYNLREGGGSNGKMSEETKKRIGTARLGKTHTEKSKRKISESQFGKTLTCETKQKMSEARRGEKSHMFGITKSEETKRKLSEAMRGEKNHMYGKTHTDESKQKISEATKGENNPMAKRVYQYAMDDNFVRSFGTSEEAGQYVKGCGSNISKCARGDRKTAYGFKWSYVKH
jgi:group I intron endonuclease